MKITSVRPEYNRDLVARGPGGKRDEQRVIVFISVAVATLQPPKPATKFSSASATRFTRTCAGFRTPVFSPNSMPHVWFTQKNALRNLDVSPDNRWRTTWKNNLHMTTNVKKEKGNSVVKKFTRLSETFSYYS